MSYQASDKTTVFRQMRLEGGFQGRTNKLVDGCYSFWQGGLFPLLHKVLYEGGDTKEKLPLNHWLFDQGSLQEYLLICCQVGTPPNLPNSYKNILTICQIL